MPRKARIEAPGALHHIIIRGIERRAIFKNAADRSDFLNRLDKILPETQTSCYARVLLTNHVHLLLKTDLKTASKEARITQARTVLCYLAVRKLKISCAEVARTLRISPATVSRATSRAAGIKNLKQLQNQFLSGF